MRIDLSHSEILLRHDGIVQLNCVNHIYTRSDLEEINVAQGIICNGGKRALLVVTNKYSDIDPDARAYMALSESTKYSIAEGYVLHSLAQKILANFYLKVNKPNVPSRFFTDVKLAEEWLRTYLPSDL